MADNGAKHGLLTYNQTVLLLDCISLGHTPLYAAEKLSGRALEKKGLGRVENMGHYVRFVINEAGLGALNIRVSK